MIDFGLKPISVIPGFSIDFILFIYSLLIGIFYPPKGKYVPICSLKRVSPLSFIFFTTLFKALFDVASTFFAKGFLALQYKENLHFKIKSTFLSPLQSYYRFSLKADSKFFS